MAQSRLEKIGTIYSKVRGFLASGAIRAEQVPIWYDVYEKFPPTHEPRWDRKPSTDPIQKILYQEDVVRARFYSTFGLKESVDLTKPGKLTSQIFIDKFISLQSEGHPRETLWDRTVQALELDGVNLTGRKEAESSSQPDRQESKPKLSLKDLFEAEKII